MQQLILGVGDNKLWQTLTRVVDDLDDTFFNDFKYPYFQITFSAGKRHTLESRPTFSFGSSEYAGVHVKCVAFDSEMACSSHLEITVFDSKTNAF